MNTLPTWLPWALVLAETVAVGWLLELLLRRRDQASTAVATPAPTPATSEPAAPLQPPPSGDWHAIPGGTLELAATGFAIALIVHRQSFVCALYGPEGMLCGSGLDVALLKQLGEKLARERAEVTAGSLSLPPNLLR